MSDGRPTVTDAVLDQQVGTETCDGGRRLRADAQRNRDKLIAAAREAFRVDGPQASLEQIARAAEVGIGTLYRHFPTRLDLVVAVYQDDIDQLVEAAEDTSLPPWQGMESWLLRFVDFGTTKRSLMTELTESANRDSRVFDLCRTRLRNAAATVIERAQRSGDARPDVDVSDVVRLLGGLAHQQGLEPDQTDRMVRIVLAGVRLHN